MPRIDPIQLLNCLSVLLSPNGGIKSRDEVQRLASLMTKFSKKLVSKCIYIQILKCTETELLGLFMGSGGWVLVHMWLTESIVTKNWPLVKELLELLLLCPVDIDRLKTNNCPKLVKELSKDDNHFAIRALASKLVEQWLKTVKGEQVVPVQLSDIPQIITEAQSDAEALIKSESNVDHENNISNIEIKSEERVKLEKNISNNVDNDKILTDIQIKEELDNEPETLPVLKISLKDGKQVISQVDDDSESKTEILSDSEKSKSKSSSKDKSDDRRSSSSSSKSTSSSKHSSRSHSSEKHKSHKSSSSRHNSSKDRPKDKDRNSSHSSKSRTESSSRKSSDKSSSSSSKSKEDRSSRTSSDKDRNKGKEEKGEKSKENSLNKSSEKSDDKTPSVHKLGKIPKLSDAKKEKPSISIEVRKPDEPKPKTVKTFNSKFRKHGLEEEVKPPPSRAAVLTKKSTPVLPPTVSIPKRPSPVHNDPPPEKKPKTVEPVEKPGAIKLIPPKPKRKYFSISFIFDIFLIFSFFPDLQWWWQGVPLMSPSVFNCLGCINVSGKSKMYNLTGSKVFLILVKYFFQINIEINIYDFFRFMLSSSLIS